MAIFSALNAKSLARIDGTHALHHTSNVKSCCVSVNAFFVLLNNLLWRLSRQDLFNLRWLIGMFVRIYRE